MNHYFVQHGKALTKDIDATRPLSDEGISETITIAQNLKKNNIPISQICHSGKERAKQTAEIIAKTLSITSVNTIDGLNPNDDVKDFSDSQLSLNNSNTMFVGHLPHLNKLISYLLCKNETTNCVTFQNSGVVCVQTTITDASILWYITPTTI